MPPAVALTAANAGAAWLRLIIIPSSIRLPSVPCLFSGSLGALRPGRLAGVDGGVRPKKMELALGVRRVLWGRYLMEGLE